MGVSKTKSTPKTVVYHASSKSLKPGEGISVKVSAQQSADSMATSTVQQSNDIVSDASYHPLSALDYENIPGLVNDDGTKVRIFQQGNDNTCLSHALFNLFIGSLAHLHALAQRFPHEPQMSELELHEYIKTFMVRFANGEWGKPEDYIPHPEGKEYPHHETEKHGGTAYQVRRYLEMLKKKGYIKAYKWTHVQEVTFSHISSGRPNRLFIVFGTTGTRVSGSPKSWLSTKILGTEPILAKRSEKALITTTFRLKKHFHFIEAFCDIFPECRFYYNAANKIKIRTCDFPDQQQLEGTFEDLPDIFGNAKSDMKFQEKLKFYPRFMRTFETLVNPKPQHLNVGQSRRIFRICDKVKKLTPVEQMHTFDFGVRTTGSDKEIDRSWAISDAKDDRLPKGSTHGIAVRMDKDGRMWFMDSRCSVAHCMTDGMDKLCEGMAEVYAIFEIAISLQDDGPCW
jgi:hypothetical protein